MFAQELSLAVSFSFEPHPPITGDMLTLCFARRRDSTLTLDRPDVTSPTCTFAPRGMTSSQGMDCEQWMVDFVRSGGFSQFCEAILARGLFGDGHPEKMIDAQQACLVS